MLWQRHGETDHNKAGIVQGHLDVPLNAQGVAQAAVTGRWFAEQGIRFDEAWSSDLSRARVVRALLQIVYYAAESHACTPQSAVPIGSCC